MAPSAAPKALLHVVCRGIVRVALPPERALRYFTPEGERAWAPGWDPAYPAAPEDDTAVGTVFVTHDHGHDTLWVVVARSERSMGYARVSPDIPPGTVRSRTARGRGQLADLLGNPAAESDRPTTSP